METERWSATWKTGYCWDGFPRVCSLIAVCWMYSCVLDVLPSCVLGIPHLQDVMLVVVLQQSVEKC